MNPISLCTQRCAISDTPPFLAEITSETTPEEFDQLLLRGYEFDTGFLYHLSEMTLLNLAALKGNVRLIRHIVNVGGKQLLNLGTRDFGRTPLFSAINANVPCSVVGELVKLNANVNIACSFKSDAFKVAETCLDRAIALGNFSIAKLLLRHGALPNRVSKEKLEGLQKEIDRTARKTVFFVIITGRFKSSKIPIVPKCLARHMTSLL